MRSVRWKVLAAAVAVTALGLTGCSSSAQPAAGPSSTPLSGTALVTAAKSEGALTVYGAASEDSLKYWTNAFTKKYGIPVTIKRLPTAALFQLFAQEESAGQHQADVIDTFDKAALDKAVTNKWLAKYTPKDADKLPQQYARPGWYYAVQNVSSPSIAYNTNNVTKAELAKLKADPMHYLASPELKGRVMAGAPQAGRNNATLWYLYTDGSASKGYGWKNAAAVAANVSKITDSTTLVQNLIQGEADFGIGIADTYVMSLAAGSGAPIGFVYPNPTSAVTDGMGVSANAPHPNAARLFDEWAASKEGVDAYAVGSNGQPIRADVKDTRKYLDEPWFSKPPTNPWADYEHDKDFTEAMDGGTYYQKWNSTFHYNG